MSKTLQECFESFSEKAAIQFEKGLPLYQETYSFNECTPHWLLKEFLKNQWGDGVLHVMYFENKEGTKELLGLGQIESFDELSAFRNLPDLPFLGFQQFAKPKHNDSLFAPNEKAFYQTPQISFMRKHQEVTITMTHKSRYPVDLTTCFSPSQLRPFAIKELEQLNEQEKQRYQASFQKAMKSLDSGELRKVVLSRRKFFELTTPMMDWRELCQRYLLNPGESFRFLSVNDKKIYLSLTPERLFYLSKQLFETEAIAGTVARGSNPEEDKRLFSTLLSDPKEMREHNIVIDDITARLKKALVRGGWVKKHQPLRLAHIQHIHSLFQGDVLDTKASLPLLAEKMISILHPTPAVGGFPRERALESLSEWEGYDRGAYAAPCSVFLEDEITVLVGLRCLCLNDKLMQLYAGSGIVEGSIEEKEWQETENKLKNFTLVAKK